MQDKILSVFYGEDRLPYKDAQRTVHYPIANGDLFCGANNTTQIRFYVDQIGGTTNVQWVATSKLPNGQIGNKVLSNPKLDDELGEHYLELDLSSYYTSIKGDVYIALNGYQGGVNIEEDEDTGIWSISGTPTIQATGSIKLGINYAPQTIPGTHFGVSDLQQILGALSDKISQINGIVVLNNIATEDLSGYELGQIFFDRETYCFYRKAGLGYFDVTIPNLVTLNNTSGTLTATQLAIVKKPDALILTSNGLCRKLSTGDDILQIFISTPVIGENSSNLSILNYVVVSIFNGNYSITTNTYNFYSKDQVDNLLANNYYTKTESDNRYDIQSLVSLGSGSSGTLSSANLEKVQRPNAVILKNYNFYYRIWSQTNSLTFESRYIVGMGSTQRLEIGKIVIDRTTGAWTYSNTSSFSVYTTSGVDNIVSTLKANSFQVVASLPATGQEGIIYLVETSSGSGVYNQYIWESGAYISLGTTQIDLSGYVEKTTSANKVYATNGSGNQTTIPVDDFYEGNIARRDSDNSITVPLTPTQNGHASSKKYVDDEINDLSNDIDDKLEEKANVDGNYPTMTVGSADNLTPYGENSGVEESTPFVFQSAGGSSDIGSQAQLRALRGNSVAFNQLQKISTQATHTDNDTGLTITNNNDGSITISGTILATKGSSIYLTQGANLSTISGRKYLTKLCASSPYLTFRIAGQNNSALDANVESKIWQGTADRTNNSTLYMGVVGGIGETINITIKPQTFDLTMFEQNGVSISSVLEFNRLFPKSYYPYNAGTLLSCKVNGYKTVGYNAFDGQWQEGSLDTTTGEEIANVNRSRSDFIKVIAGQTYSLGQTTQSGITGSVKYLYEYDGNKDFVKYTEVYQSNPNWEETPITLSNNTQYVRIVYPRVRINENQRLHLTWDSSRTGYEPYESETYPLPNVELRSAGSVYDTLTPSGLLTRRVGVVGTTGVSVLVLNAGESYERVLIYYENIDETRTFTSSLLFDWLTCNKYIVATRDEVYSHTKDKTIAIQPYYSYLGFVIYDSALIGKTAEQVLTALSGLEINYYMETPTEKQTEYTFAETTPIDDYGTQEFLYDSDIAIPVPQGNDFFYPVDYKAFIDSLGGRDDIEYAADQVVSQTQLTQALSTFLSSIQGYDATKTQTLKNVNGVFQWVDD